LKKFEPSQVNMVYQYLRYMSTSAIFNLLYHIKLQWYDKANTIVGSVDNAFWISGVISRITSLWILIYREAIYTSIRKQLAEFPLLRFFEFLYTWYYRVSIYHAVEPKEHIYTHECSYWYSQKRNQKVRLIKLYKY